MANYEKFSVCDCEKPEKLLQFLFSLDTTIFLITRSSILGENPLSNVNQAYSKIIQEEQVKNMTKEEEDNHGGAVFAVCNSGVGNIEKANLVYGHCNKTGHESRSCFQIIGFPEWWLEKSKSGT